MYAFLNSQAFVTHLFRVSVGTCIIKSKMVKVKTWTFQDLKAMKGGSSSKTSVNFKDLVSVIRVL